LNGFAETVDIVRDKSITRSSSRKKTKNNRRSLSHRINISMREREEVPFGIRALESGEHFDEVWDSRPNSTEVSRHGTLRTTSSQSAINSSGFSSPSLKRENTSHLTVNTERSGDISDLSLVESPLRKERKEVFENTRDKQYPPHSFARYERATGHYTTNSFNRQHLPRRLTIQSSANNAIKASSRGEPKVSYPTPKSQKSPSIQSFKSMSSQPYSDGDLDISTYNLNSPFTVNVGLHSHHTSLSRSASAESLIAMQRRRLSQCAETGQFYPRFQSDYRDHAAKAAESIVQERTSRRMSFEVDDRGGDADQQYFQLPSISVTANTPDLVGEMSRKQFREVQSDSALNYKSQSSPPTSPTGSTFSVSSRQSNQVLRRVNSGFAILKPGSLENRLISAHSAKTSRIRSSSTESAGSLEIRKGRRLQKRQSLVQPSKRGSSQE